MHPYLTGELTKRVADAVAAAVALVEGRNGKVRGVGASS
jgi:hypothetical protein